MIMLRDKLWFKILIATLIDLLLSFITLLIFFGFNFNVRTISDSLFIVNSVAFVISLIIHTGAMRLMHAVTYTAKTLVNYKKIREEYETFGDYYNERTEKKPRNLVYLLIITAIFIGVAFILSRVYIDENMFMF